MVITHTPVIRNLDVCSFDTPIKVMVTKLEDGKLWWKHAPVVPSLVKTERSSVKVLNQQPRVDRFVGQLFEQLFFNVYMYNDFKLDIPQKFYVEGSSFYYFMTPDVDIVVVPLFYRHPSIELIFTKFKDRFALKISVTEISVTTTGVKPNPKRRRHG